MTSLQILLFAMILDYFIGDPDSIWRRYPHPAVIFGKAVSILEQRLNRGNFLIAKGIFSISALAILGGIAGYILHVLPDFGIIELILTAVLLAHNSLIKHVRAVGEALSQDIVSGRRAVARIVGRDTENLDESGVARAAVESAAENFSDAVVAPIFWFLVLGLPGLFIYKIVNTADSMIGHRTEQYEKFGFGAAKLDDLLNWIPARLCGALFCVIYRSRESFDIMVTDAPLHASPNAGWSEAAMAAILDVALSGPRTYFGGQVLENAYLNPQGRKEMVTADISTALGVLQRAWLALVSFVALLVFLVWLL
ncbi:cobalamin biosynthesis protein CobD [Amylibacter marinus]|uniref:Cobalamin biosynthesis protein CobD n=1 Tax=Amylibacter marinus TaxID=1475483 RepID=A0ABQ5VVS9_9RHOB|nr:adenosylcobinamide-phosphate synthase CbiB [Amylibacter marinus]GLQ35279.1 cobalamin biosynthesis protein CobD [Amylibacter marinus]